MKILLASSSERRRRLLRRIVRKFSVKEARINERMLPGESFSSAAVRLAELKARKVASREKDAVVIGADTIAYRGKRIYRKTGSKKSARRILAELSGKTHYAVTGVAVLFPDGRMEKYAVKKPVFGVITSKDVEESEKQRKAAIEIANIRL